MNQAELSLEVVRELARAVNRLPDKFTGSLGVQLNFQGGKCTHRRTEKYEVEHEYVGDTKELGALSKSHADRSLAGLPSDFYGTCSVTVYFRNGSPIVANNKREEITRL